MPADPKGLSTVILRPGRGRCRAGSRRSLRPPFPPPHRPRCHGNSRGGRLARASPASVSVASRGGWGELNTSCSCCHHQERPRAEPAQVPEKSAAAGRSVPIVVEARVRGTAGMVGEGVAGMQRTKTAGRGWAIPRGAPWPHGRTCCVLAGLVGAPSPSFQRPNLRRVVAQRSGRGVSTGGGMGVARIPERGERKVGGDVGRQNLSPRPVPHAPRRADPLSTGRAAM